ncbi:VOC family protein [Haladaptatus caseinilyticus]|uniref:VOC family protein n=1 Tax=Haladaptatus caseinilyticus TaxID=2993314 RepID=UPI00224B728A|nr:VOC family protein [Haladaptatus caseinilyticus]
MTHSIQGFDHVALPVSDLRRAVSFYRDVLGLRSVDRRDPDIDDYHWLNLGQGQGLNLARVDEESRTDTSPRHIAFNAPEEYLGEVIDRLEKRNRDVRKTDTSIYFSDPDGNELEITCWREKRLRESGVNHW